MHKLLSNMSLLNTVVSSAAGLVGQGINAWSQGSMNKKTRKFSESMYDKQRKDNLSDWERQNAYNSPAAQMQRLKDAGLNPNLVYGKGADNISAPVGKADIKSWDPKAPQFDLQGVTNAGLAQYNNFALKDAQLDNLLTQNTVNTQKGLLTQAQQMGEIMRTSKTKFDLDLASELRTNSLQFASEQLRKMQADTAYQISENERRELLTGKSLQESFYRILQMREQTANTVQERQRIQAQIRNLNSQTNLNQLEAQLNAQGIYRGDPMLARIAGRILGSPNDSIQEKVKDFFTIKPNSILGRGKAWFEKNYQSNK